MPLRSVEGRLIDVELLSVFIGFANKGASVRPVFFYAAYLVCCMGVNGSNTHAVKALAGALAIRDGYGRGEFSGWMMNMRAISTSACTLLYGAWYGWCADTGRWTGSVWWLLGLLGGLLPQLVVWRMSPKSFDLEGAS